MCAWGRSSDSDSTKPIVGSGGTQWGSAPDSSPMRGGKFYTAPSQLQGVDAPSTSPPVPWLIAGMSVLAGGYLILRVMRNWATGKWSSSLQGLQAQIPPSLLQPPRSIFGASLPRPVSLPTYVFSAPAPRGQRQIRSMRYLSSQRRRAPSCSVVSPYLLVLNVLHCISILIALLAEVHGPSDSLPVPPCSASPEKDRSLDDLVAGVTTSLVGIDPGQMDQAVTEMKKKEVSSSLPLAGFPSSLSCSLHINLPPSCLLPSSVSRHSRHIPHIPPGPFGEGSAAGGGDAHQGRRDAVAAAGSA